MIITSSKEVDVSNWNTDVIKVLAIGGGGGVVHFTWKYLFCFTAQSKLFQLHIHGPKGCLQKKKLRIMRHLPIHPEPPPPPTLNRTNKYVT